MRFPTTRVRGSSARGAGRSAAAGSSSCPVEGTVGNLRSAPIRPDGPFEADRVAVGRNAIGLVGRADRAAGRPAALRAAPGLPDPPRRSPPGPRRPLDDRPARRGDPPRLGRHASRRRRPDGRGDAAMTTLHADRTPPPAQRPAGAPRSASIYRDGAGEIHLDWPADRIAEAIDDREGTVWVDIEDLESADNGERRGAAPRRLPVPPPGHRGRAQGDPRPQGRRLGRLPLPRLPLDRLRPRDRRPPAPRARHLPRPRTTW